LLVVPSGTVFRLSGRILHISFLDQKGLIIPAPSEKWDIKSLSSLFFIKYKFLYIIETKTNRSTDCTQDLNSSSILPSSAASSPSMSTPPSCTTQYAVFCSSKEARVYLIN